VTRALDRVIDALRERDCRPRASGGSWSARCPAHEDRTPSLSLRQIEGQALIYCHAGCATADVMTALDLVMADLFDEPTVGARYAYTDRTGAPSRTVHRTPDKRFRQSGNTRSTPQLYRLPQVVAAVAAGVTVYLVEGEKDVHALEAVGAVATTSPMGATNFTKVDVTELTGAQVVVVPDVDEAGARYLRDVLTALEGVAASVAVARPRVGKDAADHVAAGYGLDDLVPDAVPQVGRQARITWACDIPIRPVVWAWTDNDQGRIPAGSLSIATGREGSGKSTFGTWLAAQITRGTLPGNLHGNPRRVLYVAVEDSWEHTLAPRLLAAGADLSMVGRFDVVEDPDEQVTLSLPADNRLLEQSIREHNVALVVLDPLMSLISDRLDTHRTRDVRTALDPLVRLADRTSCLLLGIAHFNKGAGTDPSLLITGSGAFKDVPRSVLGFVRDTDAEDGSRVMTQTKNSLGRDDLPSLKYLIENTEIATDQGPAHVGRICWRGESDRTAQDILRDAGSTPEDRDERADAASWLRDYLTNRGGESPVNDVKKSGAAAGFNMDALKRAKGKAGVRSRKTGLSGGWVWALDLGATPRREHQGCEGSGEPEATPFAPLVLPSEPPEASPITTGPCTRCGQLCRRYGADGSPLCRSCEATGAA
jgi:hypothetical protein